MRTTVLQPWISLLGGGLLVIIGLAAFWSVSKRLRVGGTRNDNRSEFAFSRMACQQANDGLLVMTMDGVIQWVNPAYCRLMGYEAAELIGRNPLGFALLPDARPDDETIANYRLVANANEQDAFELHENIRKDGSIFWNQISVSFHTTASGTQYAVLVCRDVTASIEKEQELEATGRELARIAAHDDLTDAANRAELSRFLETALERARKTGSKVGVLHVDLDEFKQINDTHGHLAGDAVLVAVAQRLRSEVRETDLVARAGGDEFVVVCCGLQSMGDLKNIGNALISAVNKPIQWQSGSLECQISVGASLSNDTVQSVHELLTQSDFALYDVKRTGRGRLATYNSDLHQRHTRATERQTALFQAIHDKALIFHFQPVVSPDGGIVRGFETLVRWQHPTDGLIPPDELLPLAQSLGLMADLDFLAMNAALDMKTQLNSWGHDDVRVSFNTSPEVLGHADFCPALLSGLAFRDLNTDDVIVEVLETVVFEDHSMATSFVETLAELHAAGIFTVLDDFGSGNAGIAQLAKLAIKGVKFDKSLGMSILTDPTMEVIYKTLVGLCNELDLRMVTEGVETLAQAKRLCDLGCTNIQGYMISKPLPPDDVREWLDTYTASAIAPDDAHRYLKAN